MRNLVLERIQSVNAYIREDAESFQKAWMQCQRDGQEKSIHEDGKRIAKAKKRMSDIDTLLTSTCED